MNAQLRRRLEMAEGVREFLRAHKTDGVGEGLGLAKLEELLQRAEVLAAQQRAGLGARRAATTRRKDLRRALHGKLLLYLRAVGAVAAKENADLAEQFQMPPSNASHKALITMAHGMLEKATAHKELLIQRGMSGQLLDDLTTTLSEFEQTVEASLAARRAHIGATTDLWAVAAEISEHLKVLEGLVRYRFGDNAELMGAWASARNVLGPFKPKDEPEAGGGETPKAA